MKKGEKMNKKSWLENKIDNWANEPGYLAEEKILLFSEKIVLKMEQKKCNRAQLASNLGKSKAFVTKLLNGNTNMTIKTMVEVGQALDCELLIDLYPKGFVARTLYVNDSRSFEPIDPVYLESNQNACAA